MEAEGLLPRLKSPKIEINIYYNENCIFSLFSLFLKNKSKFMRSSCCLCVNPPY
jgi:hypothetical protein